MKTYSLEELTNKHVGKRGTPRRDAFEYELRIDLLWQAIKDARKERNLTQEQLGELVGVKKALERLEPIFDASPMPHSPHQEISINFSS